MFDGKDTAREFLEYFNSRYNRYNSINFTCEFEQAKPKQHSHHTYLMAYYLREEDIVLDSKPNGIHLHHANTKATLSATYFDASESAPPLPFCNLLSRISKAK